MLSGGGGLRPHGRTDEDAVLPVEGLVHQGDALGPATPKDDGVDGDPLGVLPQRVDDGALGGRGAEPATSNRRSWSGDLFFKDQQTMESNCEFYPGSYFKAQVLMGLKSS